MRIRKKALLYDIANMAYTIADTGEHNRHTLHRVLDICEEGNIDRVSRVLGLAYSRVLSLLLPVLAPPRSNPDNDSSSSPHDYLICFREDESMKFILTKERRLRIKETVHEYMVSMVLADWLDVTLPEAADVWKFRADNAFEELRDLLASMLSSTLTRSYRRKLSPF